MPKIEEIIGIIFALFIGIVLFMSFEPTKKIIEGIVGTFMFALFVGLVIIIVGGFIYLVIKLSNKDII